MKLTGKNSDTQILQELGKRIARTRIDRGYSQKQLADHAGVGIGTIPRMEAGKTYNLVSLIRVLRVLQLAENLDQLLPDADVRPSDWLRYNKEAPQRVARKRNVQKTDWRWGDES